MGEKKGEGEKGEKKEKEGEKKKEGEKPKSCLDKRADLNEKLAMALRKEGNDKEVKALEGKLRALRCNRKLLAAFDLSKYYHHRRHHHRRRHHLRRHRHVSCRCQVKKNAAERKRARL